MLERRTFLAAGATWMAAGINPESRAQSYPARAIRIVVAAPAGGGDDIPARLVASKLGEVLGQQVVVENRPGAAGMIGQTYVAKAPPDGYTLLLAGGSMAGAHYVNANMGYELQRDFTPISLIETVPWAFIAGNHLQARNVQEFIALARAHPGKLTWGSPGAGQIPYWAARMFNSMAGIDTVEVIYKSFLDSIVDLMAGRIDYAFPAIANAATSREKVRILAVTSRARSHVLPDVPTMIQTGLPEYEMPAWRSLMGPAGMPGDVVGMLNQAMVRSLASADLRDKLAATGSVAQSSTPEELRRRYEDWSGIFGKIAREAGLKPH